MEVAASFNVLLTAAIIGKIKERQSVRNKSMAYTHKRQLNAIFTLF